MKGDVVREGTSIGCPFGANITYPGGIPNIEGLNGMLTPGTIWPIGLPGSMGFIGPTVFMAFI